MRAILDQNLIFLLFISFQSFVKTKNPVISKKLKIRQCYVKLTRLSPLKASGKSQVNTEDDTNIQFYDETLSQSIVSNTILGYAIKI